MPQRACRSSTRHTSRRLGPKLEMQRARDVELDARGRWAPLTARLRHAVVAIDQVVTTGGDFREDYRSRQVGCPDGSLLESLAATIIRNVRELDEPNGESFRMSADKRQESCDVELEDPVRVQLIAGFGGARLKCRSSLSKSRAALLPAVRRAARPRRAEQVLVHLLGRKPTAIARTSFHILTFNANGCFDVAAYLRQEFGRAEVAISPGLDAARSGIEPETPSSRRRCSFWHVAGAGNPPEPCCGSSTMQHWVSSSARDCQPAGERRSCNALPALRDRCRSRHA
jgi:hypothetical protein